jgi:hypothetical protein
MAPSQPASSIDGAASTPGSRTRRAIRGEGFGAEPGELPAQDLSGECGEHGGISNAAPRPGSTAITCPIRETTCIASKGGRHHKAIISGRTQTRPSLARRNPRADPQVARTRVGSLKTTAAA